MALTSNRLSIKSLLLKFFSRGSLYFMKVDLHSLALRLRNTLLLRNTRKIKPMARYLNVGCGSRGLTSEDWLNLDGWIAPNVDYTCDLRRALPFGEGRFEGVYAEHFFEHLHVDDAHLFLSESIRMLKSNGVLRLSVPDGELYLQN